MGIPGQPCGENRVNDRKRASHRRRYDQYLERRRTRRTCYRASYTRTSRPFGARSLQGCLPCNLGTRKADETGLRRFYRIAEAAERYGVYLALENSVFPEYLQFIFDNIKSEHIGFCYDSGHEHAFAPDFNYLPKFGDRLFALHLHDNDGVHDNHFVPFCGTIDWNTKIEDLKKRKLWETTVTLESCIYGEETLEDGLKRSYEAAKKLAEM